MSRLCQCLHWGPGPTCADKHDIIEGPVQGLGPVHHDLRVVHVAADEPGPVVYWGHRAVHQRVVLDELQGLVRQTEGAGEVGGPRLTVDALQGADQPSAHSGFLAQGNPQATSP